MDEEDDSYESSSNSGSESEELTGNQSDGESANPYAEGQLPNNHPTFPFLFLPPHLTCRACVSFDMLLRTDFGDDARSVATARSVMTTRTDRTTGTTTTARAKKAKDVRPLTH